MTRKEALGLGLTRFEGTKCHRCNTTLRETAGGGCVQCRDSYKALPEQKEKQRAYSKKRREIRYLRELDKKYGLTVDEYQHILSLQKGRCAICHLSPPVGKKLGVDHDHKNGNIRGLLCDGCNLLIGRFSDDVSKLQNAIKYLQKNPHFSTPVNGQVKQVILMRTDLSMRKGKMIAQGAHGAVAFLFGEHDQKLADFWLKNGMTKICLQVDSEDELMKQYQLALTAGLTVHLITDAGLTEFHGVPTKTCLVIGPNLSEDIDPITGHLKLL